MSTKFSGKQFGQSNEALAQYALDTFRPEDAILEAVRKRSVSRNLPRISVPPMDGLHLEILTRMARAQHAVEVGTLGGYSAICIARGLLPQGKLFTCELSPHNAAVALENLVFAGVSDRVEIIVGPALESLRALECQGPFDLVFIDADKPSYPDYLNWALQNLKVGGVVIGDNTFAWGFVATDELLSPADAASADGIKLFNQTLANDRRFRCTILPTGEGLTVGIKISD